MFLHRCYVQVVALLQQHLYEPQGTVTANCVSIYSSLTLTRHSVNLSHLSRPTTLQIRDDEGLVFTDSAVDHSDDSGLEDILGTLRLHLQTQKSVRHLSFVVPCLFFRVRQYISIHVYI